MYEKFVDTKGVTRSRKSIYSKCNDQKKYDKKFKQLLTKHYTEN